MPVKQTLQLNIFAAQYVSKAVKTDDINIYLITF